MSIAFAVILPLICLCVVKPITRQAHKLVAAKRETRFHHLITTESAALILHALVLATLVTGSSYAGTSVLFAAYLAGAAISWWDGLCYELRTRAAQDDNATGDDADTVEPQQSGQGSSATDQKQIGRAHV